MDGSDLGLDGERWRYLDDFLSFGVFAGEVDLHDGAVGFAFELFWLGLLGRGF